MILGVILKESRNCIGEISSFKNCVSPGLDLYIVSTTNNAFLALFLPVFFTFTLKIISLPSSELNVSLFLISTQGFLSGAYKNNLGLFHHFLIILENKATITAPDVPMAISHSLNNCQSIINYSSFILFLLVFLFGFYIILTLSPFHHRFHQTLLLPHTDLNCL